PYQGALPFGLSSYPTNNLPPNPILRPRIKEPLSVGVRAIDGLLTVGKGQRVGIFAGSGVGKSTLMGMIARNTTADINVIGLIGERGREVMEFIERDLGEEGLKRSVVVVATSDQPAMIRIKGALIATSIAEYFRDRGLNVMLMMDSVTRFAMAQREVGLAIG
ncbi:flagellum-specific ATP synthase FliI, partial [Mesorhizobium sp. M00.F.Ca.ET.186.01.1.1]